MSYDRNNRYDDEEEDKVYTFNWTSEHRDCHHSYEEENHTHEFLGSTRLAEEGDDRHNHRFAGVTTGEIPIRGGNHVHGFEVNTDSVDHFHEIAGTTGPAIILNPDAPPSMRKHVHLARGTSTEVDEHTHTFIFATLIESPLLPLT